MLTWGQPPRLSGGAKFGRMVNLSAYLERIHYAGPTSPTTEVLRNLHRAHMLSVPFENLDIGLKRKIICEESSFLRKVVDLRRGGFCYELNGAFAALLRELGFKVTLLSARVSREDGSDSPEFDHLTLRVDLDEPWLADVGFGDSFVEPLRLRAGIEQLQGDRTYRLVEESNLWDMQRAERDGAWKRQYSFTLKPRRLEEFTEMCLYHQTSPESPFTRKSICSMATPAGRITLADDRLIVRRDGIREETVLASNEERAVALRQHFTVVL